MCPAIYQHPFRKDVTLPQEFMDHVMSEAGTEFIQKCKERGESWSSKIDEMKDRENTLCLLPDDAGDMELENF